MRLIKNTLGDDFLITVHSILSVSGAVEKATYAIPENTISPKSEEVFFEHIKAEIFLGCTTNRQ